jgi:hypothetical protein
MLLLFCSLAQYHEHTPENGPDPTYYWNEQLSNSNHNIRKVIVKQSSNNSSNAKENTVDNTQNDLETSALAGGHSEVTRLFASSGNA